MSLREVDLEQGGQGLSLLHNQLLSGNEERTVVVSSNWVAGVLLFLFLAGLLPLSLLVLASVLLVCLATCIRAYVVHQLEQTVSTQLQGVNSLSEAIQIVSAAGPLLVAGQPIDLNNLRLSLVQRDFGPSDYNTLLALDGSGSLLAPCQCVPEERLASLPTFKHSRKSSLVGNKGEEHLCCVCLEAFAEGAIVTQLRCKHSFHGDCIQPWLRQQGTKATCPLCKAAVWSQK